MLEGESVLVSCTDSACDTKHKARIVIDDGARVKVRYADPVIGKPRWINQDEFTLDLSS